MNKHSKLRKMIIGCLLFAAMLCVTATVHKPQTVTAATSKSSAKYPYLIKVNKKMNTVTIYKKDSKGKYTVPVKAMICSTGKNTPTGTFRTKAKYRWKWLYGNVYGQYSTRITGSILFHSVYYYKKNPATLSIKEFNKLGTSASMGCVRLQVADTKWIYNNCGIGTTVVIYNSNNPGPLGKPKAIKLNSKISWDPTDTAQKKNPFNKKKPTITGVSSRSIAYGSTYNPRKGLKAKDTCGNTITSRVVVKGTVNTKVAGTYSVVYSVTDVLKRTTRKTIKITVLPKAGMPTIVGVSNHAYQYNAYKDKVLKSANLLKGVSANVAGQKLAASYIKYTVQTLAHNSFMVQYAVHYTVTNGKYTARKTSIITLDKLAPTITGVKDKELSQSEFDVLKEQIEKKKYGEVIFADNLTKPEQLVVNATVTKINDTRYEITYTAKDEVGYVTTHKATIMIVAEPETTSETTQP